MYEATFYELKRVTGSAANLASQVAGKIGRLIVSHHYAPGTMLESEDSLAERYEVSRSVIRDAVKILVGKGLLEVRRGAGTRVKHRKFWGLLDNDVLAWTQSAPPDEQAIRSLMDFRKVFEPKAARWAAERGTQEEIGEIGNAVSTMEQQEGTVDEFVIADANFHRTILQATQNEFMVAMEGIIFSSLLSSIRLTNANPEHNANSIALHRNVLEAIKSGDGERAEMAMERLLADTGARLEKRLAAIHRFGRPDADRVST